MNRRCKDSIFLKKYELKGFRLNFRSKYRAADIEKNKKVSTVEPIKDDPRGAINHCFFLNLSKTWTSSNWANKNAVPEPIAILIDIKSSKLVENKRVKPTPIANPMYTIFLAALLP